jgi:hypothetical protein
MTSRLEATVAQEYESELPESVKATGSTNEIDGHEIVEPEVGGEGVVEVVAEKKDEKSTGDRGAEPRESDAA